MSRHPLGLLLTLAALSCAAPAAFAQDASGPVADGASPAAPEDDEFDFLKGPTTSPKKEAVSGDSFSIYEGSEDEFADFAVAPPPEEKPKPKASPAPTASAEPLTPSYKAEIVATASDSVVVELPVLVARGPADVTQDFWLVGEVWVQGRKVGETRQFVSAQGLSQLGPTTAFLKVQAPVAAGAGKVELRVLRIVGKAAPEALFTQTVDYTI